ncbi:hypothetical protein A3K80_08960 [Candidatus Bathyarchaeota archaeon RBG_13_38_9]|nr:MAG: hypothetical protein A3K80_08960 [Candidatus Bathyarchaeota archaeon RBG_13_38_9]
MSGAFNGDIHTDPYTIVFDSKMNGSYEGSTYGVWIGKYSIKYEIIPWGIKEHGDGDIEGNYTINIDDSGDMFLNGTTMIDGVLQGKMEFETDQIELESGYLTGKWKGVATIKRIVTKSFGLPTNIRILVYGEFKEKGIIDATPSQEQPNTSSRLDTSNLKESPSRNFILLLSDKYFLFIVIVMGVMLIIGACVYRVKRKRALKINNKLPRGYESSTSKFTLPRKHHNNVITYVPP